MLEDGLAQLLNADATLTSLIAGRITPLILPDAPRYPAVTLQTISSIAQYTNDGALGLAKTRIEINVWSDNYAICKTAAQAIRKVFDAYQGTLPDDTVVSGTEVLNCTDQYDSDAHIYRVQMDFSLWHSY